MASGATCVQRLDGSRDSAIHTKYRISLRSSSMQEPRYPLPRVILYYVSEHNPHENRLRCHAGALRANFKFLAHSAPGFVFWHKGERTTSSSSEPEASRGVEHLKPTLCVQTDSRVGLLVRHRQ
ncbi:hypothetical protein QL285_010035 [Trifolium repens]|nr:hypothetical protein QL285_010035 [Trifolium repens]